MFRLHYLIFILSTLLACGKNDILPPEDEREIIQSCQQNALDSEEEIAQNLIGKWKQIGYGCGFCAPHEEPKSSIEFSEESGILTIEDDFEGKQIISFTWKIIEGTNLFGDSTFQLSTKPSHYALNMDIFCDQYMAFDHTPVDGQMFLFNKK